MVYATHSAYVARREKGPEISWISASGRSGNKKGGSLSPPPSLSSQKRLILLVFVREITRFHVRDVGLHRIGDDLVQISVATDKLR